MRFIILFVSAIGAVNCAKILGFFSIPSISHQFVFQSIMKGLSLNGHDVTFITTNPAKDHSLFNITEIDISDAYKVLEKFFFHNFERPQLKMFVSPSLTTKASEEMIRIEMENECIRRLLMKPPDTFDLIIIEAHIPFFYGLKRRFHAPLIAVSSANVYSYLHYMAGNPSHPVLYPDILSGSYGRQYSFMDKLDSLYVTISWALLSELYMFPKFESLANRYFGNGSSLKEIISETDLWMLNINPFLSDRKPNVPAVIEYFNIHLKRNESLPQDLKRLLDNAKEGVVYFSLGTNVRFDFFHVDGKTILQALGDLPYTVICKWESESAADLPKNVHLRKWVPQQAVLAHPNIKVFVTQGGQQSSEEAIINGVPLVVIPFFADQPTNAKALTWNGLAETIAPTELNREILTTTILKVGRDEKYRNKAKEFRDIFLDQPLSGADKVIWWCEYVIRHKGAKHLRSPSADIPLHEYLMLDVLAVLVIALYLFVKIIKFTIMLLIVLFRKLIRSLPNNKKKN